MKPDVLLLDEPTSACDSDATLRYVDRHSSVNHGHSRFNQVCVDGPCTRTLHVQPSTKGVVDGCERNALRPAFIRDSLGSATGQHTNTGCNSVVGMTSAPAAAWCAVRTWQALRCVACVLVRAWTQQHNNTFRPFPLPTPALPLTLLPWPAGWRRCCVRSPQLLLCCG